MPCPCKQAMCYANLLAVMIWKDTKGQKAKSGLNWLGNSVSTEKVSLPFGPECCLWRNCLRGSHIVKRMYSSDIGILKSPQLPMLSWVTKGILYTSFGWCYVAWVACVTQQAQTGNPSHSGPWAKAVSQVGLPLPEARIMQTAFPSIFFKFNAGTLSPFTVHKSFDWTAAAWLVDPPNADKQGGFYLSLFLCSFI